MRFLQHGALDQIVRWMSTTELCDSMAIYNLWIRIFECWVRMVTIEELFQIGV